ncbi:presenilin family intramembrane aspartyl protease PSH [[Eubacterium] cellulosolvens]
MVTAKDNSNDEEQDLDQENQDKRPKAKKTIIKKTVQKEKVSEPPKPPEKPSLTPIIIMAIMFIVSIGFALVLAPIYVDMGLQADFEELGLGDEESLLIPLFYIVIIIVFTAIILFITRKRKGRFIKYAFLGVIGLSLGYVFWAIFNSILYPAPIQSWAAEIEVDSGVHTILYADLLGDGDKEIIVGASDGTVLVYDDAYDLLWRTEQPLNDSVQAIAVANLNNDSQLELIALAGGVYIFEASGTNNEFNIAWARTNDNYSSLVVVPDYPRPEENKTKPVVIIGSSNGTGNNSGALEMIYYENDTYNAYFLLEFDIPVNTLAYGAFEDYFEREIFIGANDGVYSINSPKSGTAIRRPKLVVSNDEPVLGIRIIDVNDKGNAELVFWDNIGNLYIYEANNLDSIWKKDMGDHIGGVTFLDFFDWIDGIEMVVSFDGEVQIYYSVEDLFDETYRFTDESGKLDSKAMGLAAGDLGDDDDPDIIVGHKNGFKAYHYIPPVYSDLPCFMGLIVAIIITAALFYYPEWYLVDIVGILVAGGVAALIGISIGLLPIIVLLIILAIYDAISVYKTKHMVSLADKVMEFKLPILLVVPKKRGYSFLRQKGLKKQLEEGEEREAMFIGLGDIIIPGTLVISAFHFLPAGAGWFGLGANLLVAIFTLVGTLIGFAVLMQFVLKGNPQAGLPLLNTGAILGFFISNFAIYQDWTFGLTLPFG